MAVPAAPAAGEPIAEAWGDVVHAQVVDMEIQAGFLTTHHAAANTSPQVTVTFPHPFSTPPVVVVSSGNYNYLVALNGVRSYADRFTIATKRVDGSSPTADVPVDWIAYGKRV